MNRFGSRTALALVLFGAAVNGCSDEGVQTVDVLETQAGVGSEHGFFLGHRIRQSKCLAYPLTAERFHTRMR